MQRSHLLVDGLWRCLCPAFDRACLSSSTAALRQTKRRRPALNSTTSGSAIEGRRRLTTEAVAPAIAPRRKWSPIPPPPKGPDAEPSTDNTTEAEGQAMEGTWEKRLLSNAHPTEATLRASSLAEITKALLTLRDPGRWRPDGQSIDQHSRILLLIGHLISARDQPPSGFLYDCLADAMADPQGSVRGLRRLLDDMAQQGMRPTEAFCRSALDALTNHPDYVMRQEILDIMQQHWFTIDGPVRQKYVLGLLRDEQYELAYSRLGEMIEKGTRIEGWVYDIFILTFGKLGYLDEMLSLLYRRSAMGAGMGMGTSRNAIRNADIVNSLLYYALDVCSQASHYEGTAFAWNAAVRSSRVQPADGILEGVLATAARRGDAQLATEAFERLSSRGRGQMHHYDAVADAFCAAGDVAAAMRTLCIMRDAGLKVTRSRTRSLYRLLMTHRGHDSSVSGGGGRGGGGGGVGGGMGVGLLRAAEAAARDLARETALPQEVVGTILEAMAAREGSASAMRLYADVPLLCGGELPSASTIQDIVVHWSGADEARRSLLREYAERFPDNYGGGGKGDGDGDGGDGGDYGDGVGSIGNGGPSGDPKRSAITYGLLTRACAEVGEMDLAFRFARRVMAMAKGDRHARKRPSFLEGMKALVESAVEREDGRIWPVVDELQRGGVGRKVSDGDGVGDGRGDGRGRGRGRGAEDEDGDEDEDEVGKLLQKVLQRQRIARLAAEWKAKKGRRQS